MTKTKLFITAILIIMVSCLTAQVAINIDGSAPATNAILHVKGANGNSFFINTNTGAVGIGLTNPNESAILDLESSNMGFLPPRMTEDERDAIANPAEGLMIYNTKSHQPNYYDGTRWMKFDGTSAGPLAIGDPYLGGVVAYMLQPGDPGYNANLIHGIVAASTDQSIGYGTYGLPWWSGTAQTIATGTAYGTGQANTIAIVSTYGEGSYAARICADLVSGGYNDWYLPSKDELNKLYINRSLIGGFDEENYWSSSDISGSPGAWAQSFSNGGQFGEERGEEMGVRAIRVF